MVSLPKLKTGDKFMAIWLTGHFHSVLDVRRSAVCRSRWIERSALLPLSAVADSRAPNDLRRSHRIISPAT